jgi:hypothetical protein
MTARFFKPRITLALFEVAHVFLRFNHVARVIVKPFCHAGQNFPKERVKA